MSSLPTELSSLGGYSFLYHQGSFARRQRRFSQNSIHRKQSPKTARLPCIFQPPSEAIADTNYYSARSSSCRCFDYCFNSEVSSCLSPSARYEKKYTDEAPKRFSDFTGHYNISSRNNIQQPLSPVSPIHRSIPLPLPRPRFTSCPNTAATVNSSVTSTPTKNSSRTSFTTYSSTISGGSSASPSTSTTAFSMSEESSSPRSASHYYHNDRHIIIARPSSLASHHTSFASSTSSSPPSFPSQSKSLPAFKSNPYPHENYSHQRKSLLSQTLEEDERHSPVFNDAVRVKVGVARPQYIQIA